MVRACWGALVHDDWQRAYALLQFIMQVVTVEVCASLIFPAASAPPASPTMLVASNTLRVMKKSAEPFLLVHALTGPALNLTGKHRHLAH
jgi:hypothetical protein